jgi:hypothetical protein
LLQPRVEEAMFIRVVNDIEGSTCWFGHLLNHRLAEQPVQVERDDFRVDVLDTALVDETGVACN